MKLIDELALAIDNARRKRIGLPPLTELEPNSSGQQTNELLYMQAHAVESLIEERLLDAAQCVTSESGANVVESIWKRVRKGVSEEVFSKREAQLWTAGYNKAIKDAHAAVMSRHMGDNNREDVEVKQCANIVKGLKK